MFRVRTPHLAASLIAAVSLTACAATTTTSTASESTATTAATTATTAAGTAENATATTAAGDTSDTSDHAGDTLDGQAEDATADWDEAAEVTIWLADGATQVSGGGVTVDGDVVTITAAGTYRISGALTDGQVVVDTADEDVVRLVLDGADVSSSTSAAILVANADAAVVWLAEGSTNHVAGGTASSDDTTDTPNAALYSGDDLTIAGTGSLSVEGTAVDGITSKDDLLIVDGTIEVTAVDDGLRGKDQLVVTGGTVTVDAGGDGLTSDNAGETDETTGASNADAVGHVVVAGGQVAISADTDGIDAANTVTVGGGALSIAAGDDAIHADQAISMSAGSVDITQSNEGVESLQIEISGGELSVVASDDGINVADGSGGGPGGRGGAGGSATASNGMSLVISGGTVTVDAGGDGIDIGGSFTITGGTITVYGPTEQMNGALDVDGAFTVSDAVLVAGGSAGMAEAPEGGDQPVLSMTFGSALPAGSAIAVAAEDGTVVAVHQSPKQIESLVVTSPDLVAGTTYTVSVDGEAVGTITA